MWVRLTNGIRKAQGKESVVVEHCSRDLVQPRNFMPKWEKWDGQRGENGIQRSEESACRGALLYRRPFTGNGTNVGQFAKLISAAIYVAASQTKAELRSAAACRLPWVGGGTRSLSRAGAKERIPLPLKNAGAQGPDFHTRTIPSTCCGSTEPAVNTAGADLSSWVCWLKPWYLKVYQGHTLTQQRMRTTGFGAAR